MRSRVPALGGLAAGRCRLAFGLAGTLVLLGVLCLAGPAAAGNAAAGRAWLGVTVVDADSAEDLPAEGQGSRSRGVVIVRTAGAGPAASAGLRGGDVVLSVGGTRVETAEALGEVLASRRPGEALRLAFRRGSATRDVKVILAPWPANAALAFVEPASPARTPPPEAPEPPGGAARPRALSDAVLSWAGQKTRPCLGVECLDLTPGLARYLGAPAGGGVLVDAVVDGTPAAAAGLLAGDVLIAIDGERVASVTELADALRRRDIGRTVRLEVIRAGAPRRVSATLASCDVPTWVLESPWPSAAPTPRATPRPPDALSPSPCVPRPR